MESQPQIPEFRKNPENFNPCTCLYVDWPWSLLLLFFPNMSLSCLFNPSSTVNTG